MLRAGRHRLDDVATRADAAIGNDRNPGLLRCRDAVEHGRELGDANPRDHPRRADAAGADADLDAVHARVEQRPGALDGRHVAGDDGHVELLLDGADGVDDVLGVAVRGIDDDDVAAGTDQTLDPLEVVHADRCAHDEPAAPVARRVGILLETVDVLDRDQPLEATIVVDQDQLLDLVGLEDLASLLQRRVRRRGHETCRRHHVADRGLTPFDEAQIPTGQDPDDLHLAIDDRQAADAVVVHQVLGVADRSFRAQGDRVQDDAVGTALDLVDLGDLALDGQVLWMMPIPPCCASATDMDDSVTVSIAALAIGTCNRTPRQNQVSVLTSRGSADAICGTSRTSS